MWAKQKVRGRHNVGKAKGKGHARGMRGASKGQRGARGMPGGCEGQGARQEHAKGVSKGQQGARGMPRARGQRLGARGKGQARDSKQASKQGAHQGQRIARGKRQGARKKGTSQMQGVCQEDRERGTPGAGTMGRAAVGAEGCRVQRSSGVEHEVQKEGMAGAAVRKRGRSAEIQVRHWHMDGKHSFQPASGEGSCTETQHKAMT